VSEMQPRALGMRGAGAAVAGKEDVSGQSHGACEERQMPSTVARPATHGPARSMREHVSMVQVGEEE